LGVSYCFHPLRALSWRNSDACKRQSTLLPQGYKLNHLWLKFVIVWMTKPKTTCWLTSSRKQNAAAWIVWPWPDLHSPFSPNAVDVGLPLYLGMN
jgi:hypothetical protein